MISQFSVYLCVRVSLLLNSRHNTRIVMQLVFCGSETKFLIVLQNRAILNNQHAYCIVLTYESTKTSDLNVGIKHLYQSCIDVVLVVEIVFCVCLLNPEPLHTLLTKMRVNES